jgi:hypothetical protein
VAGSKIPVETRLVLPSFLLPSTMCASIKQNTLACHILSLFTSLNARIFIFNHFLMCSTGGLVGQK